MTDTTLDIKIVLDGTGKAENELTAVNRQISAMADKAKGAGSATHYLNEEVAKSATAASAAAEAFEREAAAKRASITASGQLGASAKQAGEAIKSGFGRNLQNVSYQMQDVIVQMNGGVGAAKALGQQLPQMLVGFGAIGAAIGVLLALLPNLAQAFTSSADNSKTLDDAMSDLNKAVGAVGSTVKTFDMDKLYEQFNASSAVVRQATIDQLTFQREFIKTQQLVSSKKFGESLGGLGEYGTIQKLAGSFGATGSEHLSKQLGISGDVAKDLLPMLNGLKSGTEDVNLAFNRFGTVLLSGNAKAVELASTMSDLAKSQRDAAAASSAISEAQAKMSKGHVQTKKEAEEIERAHKAGASAAQKEAEALKALMDSINGKASEFDTAYVKNVETLLKAYDKGSLTLGEFNAVFERYIAMQPGAVAAEKERVKLLKEEEAYREKSIAALAGETEKLLDKALASEKEIELIGLSASDLEKLTEKRYDEEISIRRAEVERLIGIEGREAEVYLIEQQIGALERLKSSEVSKGRLQESAREWQKFTDDIERSLTDALYRAFEAGDSFGEAFAKSLENTFKTMVLKFAVQATVNGAGQVAASASDSLLGTSFSGGGSGGIGGTASNLNSIYNAFGSSAGYGASAASLVAANAAGAMGGDAIGTLIAGNAATWGVEAGAVGGMSGALGAVAAAAPYVAAVVAVAMMVSQLTKAGGPKFEGSVFSSLADTGIAGLSNLSVTGGKAFSTEGANTSIANMLTPLSESIISLAKRYGGSASGLEVGLGYSTAPDGKNSPDMIAGSIINKNTGASYNHGYTAEKGSYATELGVEAKRLMLAGLQQSGIDEWANEIVQSVNAATATGPQIDALFARLEGVGSVVEVMNALGDGTVKFTEAMIAAMGGVDAARASLASYYDLFYSDAEKTARLNGQVAQAFADINLEAPDSIEGFRALVDGLDTSTASGQMMFAALMNLAPAFAQVANAASASAAQLAAAAAQAASIKQSWQDRLDVLTGVTTQEALALRDDLATTTDEATQAIIKQVHALEAQQKADAEAAAAAQAAAQAAQQLADEWRNINASLIEQARRLRGEMGGEQSIAALQAQFAIDTAAARAGDQDAARRLVGLSGSLSSAYEKNANSALDIARYNAGLAFSLDQTAGLQAIGSASTGPFGQTPAVVGEIRQLRDENRAQALALAGYMASMDKIQKRWDSDGMPSTRVEA